MNSDNDVRLHHLSGFTPMIPIVFRFPPGDPLVFYFSSDSVSFSRNFLWKRGRIAARAEINLKSWSSVPLGHKITQGPKELL